MAHGTPEEVAAEWAAKLGASTEKIRRGVQRVQTAPGQLAARQQQKWLHNITQSAPKWANRVASVSLGEWQQATIEKGVNRVAGGAQAAQPKFAAFMSELLPYQDRLKAQVAQMPSTTLEDNIGRMTAFVRGMSQFRSQRRGGMGGGGA